MSEWAECSPLVQGQGLKPRLIPTAGAPTGLPARSCETRISHQLTKKLYQVDWMQTWHGKRNPLTSALGWVPCLLWARHSQQDLTESKMQFRGLWKMNKFELNQHMAFISWRNGYELQSRLPRGHGYSLWSLEFHSHFGAQSVKTICQRRIHPRRHWEGNAIASAEELSYTKGEVWLNHSFSDSHQGFPKVESCTLWKGRYRPRATLYCHYLLHWDGSDKGRKKCEEKPRWAHQSVSWGVLWGRPSAGRRSYRRDIWTVSPQSATWCASAGSPSG